MSGKNRDRSSLPKPRYLTHDQFDYRDAIFSRGLAAVTLSSLPFLAYYFLDRAGVSLDSGLTAALATTLLVPGYTGIRLASAGVRALHSARKDTDRDAKLGFKGYHLAYAGNDVVLGDKRLRRGDNIYFLKLPVLQGLEPKGARRFFKNLADGLWPNRLNLKKEGTEADSKLWLSVYDGIIAQVKPRLSSRRIDWLGIEVPPQAPPLVEAALKTQNSLTRQALVLGKDFSLIDPQRRVTLVHKTGLEEFTIVKQAILQQACAMLGDSRVNALMQQLEVANPGEEAQNAQERLRKHLQGLIVRYVEEGSSSSLVRRLDIPFLRTKTAVTTRVYRRYDGQLMVQSVPTTGGLISAPRILSRAVGLGDIPPERVVESPEAFNRAQVAFAAHEFINQSDAAKLLERKPPAQAQVQALLHQYSKEAKSNPLQGEIDLQGTTGKKISLLPKVARQAVLMMGLAGAMHFGFKGFEWFSPPNYRDSQSTAVKLLEGGQSSLSANQIDWWITTTGEPDPRGYYVTSTAHFLDKGRGWVDEDTIDKLVAYPTEPDPSSPHFSLQTRLRVGKVDLPQIKIPIKPNTVVEAVRVSDSKNNTIQVTNTMYKDGTVGLYIPLTPNLKDSYADITISLKPADQGQVHADGSLNRLNPDGLSQEAESLFTAVAERYIRTGDYYQSVVDVIAEGHLYNNNPKNTSEVKHQTNPAAFLNIVNHLPGCNCELCNIEAVLVAHFLSPNYPSLNLAIGYGVGLDNPAPRGGYPLRISDLHLYTMRGRAIYDATPKDLARDAFTRQYIERSKQVPDASEWARQRDELASKVYIASLFEKTIDLTGKVLMGTSLTIWSLCAAALIYELQSNFTQKTLGPFMDAKVRDRFSRQELEAMKHFLDWISWGEDRPFSPAVYSARDKQALLNDLMQGSYRQRLGQYLKKPSLKESDQGFEECQRRKVRALANYARGGLHKVSGLVELYT
ncbi:hypothetical protein A3E86_03860 [Candidatus Daviesbacteria bacterium RIFCSPHIGHO2_12_FULL_47_45]|nr:MAG: hypothetical protein A3E86_03860 [Candidatus Daviesbacteria bacterium RIFCSPHIGHO2_12_FULL_47_45]